MTSSTAHQGHHLSVSTLSLAFVGALLAGAVGFGVATVVLDEVAPESSAPADTTVAPGTPRPPIEDPNGFLGTNREERALMHRR